MGIRRGINRIWRWARPMRPALICIGLALLMFLYAGVRMSGSYLWVKRVAEDWRYGGLARTDHALLLPVRLIYPDGLISSYRLNPHALRLWDWAILLFAQAGYLYVLWLIVRRPLLAGFAAWQGLTRSGKIALASITAVAFLALNVVERGTDPLVTGWPLLVYAHANDVDHAYSPHLTGLAANAFVFGLLALTIAAIIAAMKRLFRGEEAAWRAYRRHLWPKHPLLTVCIAVSLAGLVAVLHVSGYKVYGKATLVDPGGFEGAPELTAVHPDGTVELSNGRKLRLANALPVREMDLDTRFWSAHEPLLVKPRVNPQGTAYIQLRKRIIYPPLLIDPQAAPPTLPKFESVDLGLFLLDSGRALPVLGDGPMSYAYRHWLEQTFPRKVSFLRIPPSQYEYARQLASEIEARYQGNPHMLATADVIRRKIGARP